jgi:hypothetical protein
MDRDGGGNVKRARDRFERKRKSSDYNDDSNHNGRGGGGRDDNRGGGRDDNRGGGRDDKRGRDNGDRGPRDNNDRRDQSRGPDRDRGRDSNNNSSNNNNNNTSSGNGSRRRSLSPPRWERGKKQKQKTQTDVPPERELFVGNVPSQMDERFLLNFLNGAMRQANLCPRQETPCLTCQINSGNFAFVEMISADMANKCLNLNGVLFLNSRLKVGRPKKYAGPFVVAKTWQDLTGEALTVDAMLDSEAEKVNRELFVGNTTPEMTDQMLLDFMGSAMEQVGLNVMDGNPITACEMFGKYAFIECRTPREATNALNLNNIPFMGSNLQVTRPSKWQGKWDKHCNWEHVLAKHNILPEDFQLGTIVSPAVIAATPNEPTVEGENINAVKAELSQMKRALEITRRQLEESSKKSEARKEQLVSLNKKWSEGKTELTDRAHELRVVKKELQTKNNGAHDMDSRIETHELKKKHEETQGMLRGVTESLVKATEKLANERKMRRELEGLMQQSTSAFHFDLEDESTEKKKSDSSAMAIDFASLRAEMGVVKMDDKAADDEQMEDVEPTLEAVRSITTTLTVDTDAPKHPRLLLTGPRELYQKRPEVAIVEEFAFAVSWYMLQRWTERS